MIPSEKGQKPSKKTGSYYPFGLKQKGYNVDIQGGNNLAQNWKYNGTELNQDLGLNLYEMDFRSYDPAIARFNGIDPVTHHSQGTSVAFDNNPVFWADPSGADANVSVTTTGGAMSMAAAAMSGQDLSQAYTTRGLSAMGDGIASAINSGSSGSSSGVSSNSSPEDWFKNKKGDVTWFDNTSDSFSNENGDWSNVGSNLNEVKGNLNVPDNQNFLSEDLEFISLGGGAGKKLSGAFGSIRINSSIQVSITFNLENAGNSGLERIDGTTNITGVNINIIMSSETAAPGIQFIGIGGSFGVKSWTTMGKTNINNSSFFTSLSTPPLSFYNSNASGQATLTLGLSYFRKLSKGSISIGINSTAIFKTQYDDRKGSFSTSNTINIKN